MTDSNSKIPFKVWRQQYLPQHALSRFAGLVSHCQITWVKNWIIQRFMAHYGVTLTDTQITDYRQFSSFHDFFTRRLTTNARPFSQDPRAIGSPVDGTISQVGTIEAGQLIQAKSKSFTVEALLGNKQDAEAFEQGRFLTVYLAPKDYHRVHMPLDGMLHTQRFIPGKLFSVNPLTTDHIDNLFARNERLVTLFHHEKCSFAMVLVGAMLVGSIQTPWAGTIAPAGNQMREQHYPETAENHIFLKKSEEMGAFSLGSTVILLFPSNCSWQNLSAGDTLEMGQTIGHIQS